MKRLFPVFILMLLLCGCETTRPLSLVRKDLRVQYINRNPHFPEDIKKAIKKGQVIPGMTKNQVVEVWGEPHWRGRNRWEYKGWRNIYVMFDGDTVVSVNFYT